MGLTEQQIAEGWIPNTTGVTPEGRGKVLLSSGVNSGDTTVEFSIWCWSTVVDEKEGVGIRDIIIGYLPNKKESDSRNVHTYVTTIGKRRKHIEV